MTSDIPPQLKPYTFHGVDLTIKGNHGIGNCPFCKKEGKFSADVGTGLWRCWSCGAGTERGGGNANVFIRLLHEVATKSTSNSFYDDVATDRRLLQSDTPRSWGVVSSPLLSDNWLVAGYKTDGSLYQLYKRTWLTDNKGGGWRLLPTPGIWREGYQHGIHLVNSDLDSECKTVYIFEGPWDGMSAWEVSKGIRKDKCQILAVPGCNVWRDEWTAYCKDKDVVLFYDSDHPREEHGRTIRPGYDGMKRVAGRLKGIASSVKIIHWGKDGYDENKPNGYDVRDHLSGDRERPRQLRDRRTAFADLLSKVGDLPVDWATNTNNGSSTSSTTKEVESVPCEKWDDLHNAWKEALHMHQDLSDALAVVLAVCVSTDQAGNQLFLDLIGSPGSAKTTILRGLLVSPRCIHLENVTKILSGFKKKDDDTKDCSFLARANNKTWITCEFDVLAHSHEYKALMGKMRRIFDGETSATYGNSDEDRVYSALRTPWIRAGTPNMVDHDQSQLGDRFLRFVINDPIEDVKRQIVMAALEAEVSSIVESSNCSTTSLLDPKLRKAYALTGGYVDWLRANAENLLLKVTVGMPVEIKEQCADLAFLCSDMRAHPVEDKRKKERNDFKELPTRLARQNIRLSACLAVAMGKSIVNSDVMKIIRRVSLDTAKGNSLRILNWMCSINPKSEERKIYQHSGGIPTVTLDMWLDMPEDRFTNYLSFLRKIDVLRHISSTQSQGSWVLTDRVFELFLRVMRI